jgi:antitoxin VapB
MALSIKHPEADRLARRLAAITGESITEATIKALEERLLREQGRVRGPRLRDELRTIRERCAALPVLDPRSPDEILGYDDIGVPT